MGVCFSKRCPPSGWLKSRNELAAKLDRTESAEISREETVEKMFGSKRGWLIAGAVLVVEIGVLAWLFTLDGTSGQTVLVSEKNLGVIALPTDARSLVPNGTSGDAGARYREIIEDYVRNEFDYARFDRSGTIAEADRIAGIGLLLEARGERFKSAFEPELRSQIVSYDARKPALQAMRAAASAASRVATLQLKEGDFAPALEHYEAIFAMGIAMFEERLTSEQMLLGIEMMGLGAAGMRAVADRSGESSRVVEIEKFQEDFGAYVKDHIRPLQKALLTIDSNLLAQHAGDRFAFASRSTERVWRVTAVQGLGLMREDVGVGGARRTADLKGAARLLKTLAESDPDPIVQHAARVAVNLTTDEARMAIRAVAAQ